VVALLGPALSADVAFGVVFGVFLLALAVLAVVAIRWGVRRDRPGREAWRRRRMEAPGPSQPGGHSDGPIRSQPEP